MSVQTTPPVEVTEDWVEFAAIVGDFAVIDLSALTLKERLVLYLAGMRGLTPTQASRILDCTPTAARSRLNAARSKVAV